MKTYEEMARDVLKRRDEELSNITQASPLQSQINPPPEVVYPAAQKKHWWIPKIAIPCAAAVLVGTVGITVWKNVQKNNSRGMYINPCVHVEEPGIAADEGYIFQNFVREKPESIYKGGKTEININEAEYWNVYHLPALLEEDFQGIDDDKINNYYGMDFDRLSKLFPDWEFTHEPFGFYAHDEDDGFVASHAIKFTANSIEYAPDDGDVVIVAASLIEKYDSATVENAKTSVVNGFDAMIYHVPDLEYSADITMGSANITIRSFGVDEEEFLNILDVYTKPDKNSDNNQNNNQNQTMEDKIVVYNGIPGFISDGVPYEPEREYETGCKRIRYTTEQLNALYGINFTCLSRLHSDWQKIYAEKTFGIYVRDYVGGEREIVSTRNELSYNTSNGDPVAIIAMKDAIPETDIEHSLINGFDAVIFLGYEDGKYKRYGAVIDMDGTLVCISTEGKLSDDDFVNLLREYTTEASKYDKHENPVPEPTEFATFSAVDPFDDRLTYEVDWDAKSCWWTRTSDPFDLLDLYGQTEDSDVSLGYLQEFFGTDKLPVDEKYKVNFERDMYNGEFNWSTDEGAKAYSPVDGKVVGACTGWYNYGLGNSVAVEFDDDKIFIIGHLDEVNVEVGDTVKAGDVLGVCGRSGTVYFGDPTKLSLIAMKKVD